MPQNNSLHGKHKNTIYIYLSMFFTAMSLFIYETLLTRLFSAILSYSLVFIVVSFAILGGGIGAIISYKLSKKQKSMEKILAWTSVLLPVSFILSIALMYFLPFTPTFLLYIPAALFPFILGGIINSIIFKERTGSSNKLYLMDLLGAGLGSLLIIKLMNSFGFLGSVIIVTAFGIVSAIGISLYYRIIKTTIISSIGFIVMSILLISGNLIDIVGKNFSSYYTSPVTVIGSYKNSKNPAEIEFSKWDAISKTDVIDIKSDNEKLIVTDGGAAAPIVKFNGNLDSVKELKSEVNYIPFSFGKNEKSLVIGSGGGKDVLFALLGGNIKIDAIEINPSTIAAVNEFKEFSGNIYNYPGVNLHNQDGRYFIENSKDKYDNIYLSMVMTNSVENTMYSLAEYYIFTEEALNQYLNHLSEDGKLTFMVHDSKDLIKVVNTGIKVLLDKGIKQKDVTNYFTIINGVTKTESEVHGSGIAMPLVIFRNKPFTQEDINSIVNTASIQNRDMIHFPGNEIEPYKSLKTEKMTYEQLIDNISFNSKPITDNSPFFYNNSKFIPVEMIFILALILTIVLVVKKKFLTTVEYKKTSLYFASLGVAYMLVEIPLIQKMVLYFGSSSIAFSFIVFSLLISSGIGSLISGNRIVEKYVSKSPYYILAAGIMILVNQMGLSSILNLTKDWQTTYKFIVVFLDLLPMGLLMGMAFPSGLKKLGSLKGEEGIVPLMIGINGIFSVLGSTLAVIISMKLGFSITVYIGAAIYITLFIFNPLTILSKSK
ncbi:class I SAM-dependent methyltransferase [Clostridium kluyveri]|uniref:class I SAM-dependent methyltransferase n=1 Tax=Clostridium kluyveri TaxID=1534 RepID=UPI002248187B|nr:class I SAM-dependent methyltransferase [Clostridium kluyveri]UZQ48932.1 class I SAM-dependent methyltransferase [Clostridium kluyveri]